MVEFAFTFILFCVILVAIVIFGWFFFSYATIYNAARDGSHHLMNHPVLPDNPPDQPEFATADAEATWVVTTSMPLMDWTQMTLNLSPSVDNRFAGGYVAVEIVYDIPLPTISFPLGFTDDVITIIRPMRIRTLSRRNLD